MRSKPSEMTIPPSPQPVVLEQLLNLRLAGAAARFRGPWTVTGPLARSEQSATYRARCSGLRSSLLIKRPHGGRASAWSQYEALRIAGQRLQGHAQLRVPQVYPYLLDDGFLIMD